MPNVEIISIDLSSDSEPEITDNRKENSATPNLRTLPASNNEEISSTNPTLSPAPTVNKSLPRKSKVKKADQKIIAQTLKERNGFLAEFDPENSNREKRKLSKKLNSNGNASDNNVKSGHDGQGVIHNTTLNICDCLIESCPGCFFPCPTCRSCKCGIECRNNRKWIVEAVENEADHTSITNPILNVLDTVIPMSA